MKKECHYCYRELPIKKLEKTTYNDYECKNNDDCLKFVDSNLPVDLTCDVSLTQEKKKCDLCLLYKWKNIGKSFKTISVGSFDLNLCERHYKKHVADFIIQEDLNPWYEDENYDTNVELSESSSPEATLAE